MIRGEKNIKRELTEQLDITRQRNAQIDRENEDLKLQLTANSQALKSLKLEVSVVIVTKHDVIECFTV